MAPGRWAQGRLLLLSQLCSERPRRADQTSPSGDCSPGHVSPPHLHQRRQLGHGDLLGSLHGHGDLLLVLPVEEGQHLADDGVQPLADLRLLVHLHVEAVGHLVVLRLHRINEKFYGNSTVDGRGREGGRMHKPNLQSILTLLQI